MLQYQLIATPLEQLRTRYQVTEGLEYRIKRLFTRHFFCGIYGTQKTKRYTRTRLQRLMCYLLFQEPVKKSNKRKKNTGIRILGFTTAGQTYLKQVKKKTDLPLISKFGKRESERFWVFFTGRSNLSVGITTDCRNKILVVPYFSKRIELKLLHRTGNHKYND